MSLKVIKFVAGAGKTSESIKTLATTRNGLYIAFNNKVVNDVKQQGYLSKTFDSLFLSYILPKFTSVIPLISNGAIVKHSISDGLPQNNYRLGAGNISISEDGKLFNKSKEISINLNTTNLELYNMENFPNSNFVKQIFTKKALYLNNQQRKELSNYIIKNYQDELVELMEKRFSYIIIDEAQDLNGYMELFAKVLQEKSKIDLIVFGDDFQNINGGGKWFESLSPNETKLFSYRSPNNICDWIRDNLNIEIYGTNKVGDCIKININDVSSLDDGNRVLLYYASTPNIKSVIDSWTGNKMTIKKVKGETIDNDVVIVGKGLNEKNYYVALTRTTKNAYSTITKISR